MLPVDVNGGVRDASDLAEKGHGDVGAIGSVPNEIEQHVEAGADAGAGESGNSDAFAKWRQRRDARRKKTPSKYCSVGVSSTEHLFRSNDVADLNRYLHLTRIISKATTHISRAQGPQEILEWLSVCSSQFWTMQDSITAKVCLKDRYAPESLTPSSSSTLDLPELSPLPPHHSSRAEDDLYCLDLRASAFLWAENPRAGEGDELCLWFGASTRLLNAEWSWVDLGELTALRLCYQLADPVHDENSGHGWRFPEHARMQDKHNSMLYMPLSVRDEHIGVLWLSSPSDKEFMPAERDIFAAVTEVAAVHLKAWSMQFDMDRRRRAVELDRAKYRELASAYRELLNDILPEHIVDELSKLRAPSAHQVPADCNDQDDAPDLSLGRRRITRSHSRSIPPLPSRITMMLDKLTYAENHECVAILFSDVKGFTALSEAADPAEIMLMLDDLFGRFDQITERHAPAAYKVETIGDAYMIAFGLFGQTGSGESGISTEYAVSMRAIVVGAEMIQASRQVMMPSRDGFEQPVEIRIGLQWGRIMSGIIGKKVPRYCMFGDTVNTASRMESTGVPGKIHVTDRVHDACWQRKRGRELAFKSTGGLNVKGKGWMETFLLDPEQVLSLNICQGPVFRHSNSGGIEWTTTASVREVQLGRIKLREGRVGGGLLPRLARAARMLGKSCQALCSFRP